jgi:tetratricopeptide (TPR) repeat protein
VLHEEVGRLPERYRAVVVLCYLEGLTYEEAAGRLGWPVGTVKSRLARGRERLRGRLIRRGLAPSAGFLGVALAPEAAWAVLPPLLVRSTAQTAVFFAAGQAASRGAVPASVAALTRGILISMFLNQTIMSIGVALVIAAASIGISSFAQGTSADPPAAKARGAKAVHGNDETPVRPEPVLEEALRAADQITSPWMKAQALADIGAAQARLGQAETARATFRWTAQIIEGLGGDASSRAANLSWLARAQATAGDLVGARATIPRVLEWAAKIDGDGKRQTFLLIAATREAKAGDPEGALRVVDALNGAPTSVRAFVLAEIAGEQAKAGDLRGAHATMARADAEAGRAEAEWPPGGAEPAAAPEAIRLPQVRGLAPLAEAEAKVGQVDDPAVTALRRALAEAEARARRIDDPVIVELRRALLQRERAVAGQRVDPAVALDPMRLAQVRGLAPLARAEAKAGQVDAARATLRRARAVAGRITEEWRPTPLAEIAMAQKKVGDRKAADATFNLALKIAGGLEAPDRRARAAPGLTIVPDRRIEALARLAILQAESGDRTGARRTLDKAVQIADADADHSDRIRELVSEARAMLGDWEGIRRLALSGEIGLRGASLLESLAFQQAKAGEARDALEWAAAQTAPLLRAHALLGVVRGITERRMQTSGE